MMSQQKQVDKHPNRDSLLIGHESLVEIFISCFTDRQMEGRSIHTLTKHTIHQHGVSEVYLHLYDVLNVFIVVTVAVL